MPVRGQREDAAAVAPEAADAAAPVRDDAPEAFSAAAGSVAGEPRRPASGEQHAPMLDRSRHPAGSARREKSAKGGLTLLVIEDGLADGVRSVPDILGAVGGYVTDGAARGGTGVRAEERIRVRTARNLTEAERLLTDDVQCILLDLALPGGPPGMAAAAAAGTAGVVAGGGVGGGGVLPVPGPREPVGEARGTAGRGPQGGLAALASGTPGAGPGLATGAGAGGGPAAGPGGARPGTAQAGTGQAGTAQAGTGQAGTAQAGTGRAGTAQAGTAQAGGGHPGAAQAGAEAPAEEQPAALEMLRRVLRLAPRHAVLALTDGSDAERAAAAVRVGAQDYLFRDELDGRLLHRAIRYAVERKRADLAQQKLAESRLRAQENARLERGLLPTPLLAGSDLRFAARYRPGRSRALLGGDFYDTVRTADGTVHAMIGDVCGHGPDEAALGVELRIAWRALTFAGLCGDQLLNTLQRVLEHERRSEEVFATLCTVDISADGRSAGVCLAGHPSPLVAGGSAGAVPRLLPYEEGGPALGVLGSARWPRRQVELGRAWSLLMYTDGLIEGRIGEGRQRLGQEGMAGIVAGLVAQGVRGEALLDATLEEVRRLNGDELTDDVALLLLDRG